MFGDEEEIEEGSIRLRSPAAIEGIAEEKGRVTPFRITCGLLVEGDCFV